MTNSNKLLLANNIYSGRARTYIARDNNYNLLQWGK